MLGCLLLLASSTPSCFAYYRCPDGSDGLTIELYEAGDPLQYVDVTCIPQKEFSSYNGDVTLTGGAFKRLQSIEYAAFSCIKGTLTITGTFPLLTKIGDHAFRMSNARVNSKVEFIDAPLASIGNSAFQYFKGVLAISGNFPGLVVESRAFFGAGDAGSLISVCSATVASDAFDGYKGTRGTCTPSDTITPPTTNTTATATTIATAITATPTIVATTTTTTSTTTTATASTQPSSPIMTTRSEGATTNAPPPPQRIVGTPLGTPAAGLVSETVAIVVPLTVFLTVLFSIVLLRETPTGAGAGLQQFENENVPAAEASLDTTYELSV
jgi:hypothetical protein